VHGCCGQECPRATVVVVAEAPKRQSVLPHGLIVAPVQIPEVGLEPEFDPEPEHASKALLLITAHRSSRRDIADIPVSAEFLETPNQLAIFANFQSFIKSTNLHEILFPAENQTRTAAV